jgi:hypothetical protein
MEGTEHMLSAGTRDLEERIKTLEEELRILREKLDNLMNKPDSASSSPRLLDYMDKDEWYTNHGQGD